MFRRLLFCGVLIVCAVAAAPPRRDDPYLWLEDVSGQKALDWVKKQNAETAVALTRSAGFQELQARALKTLTSKERVPWALKAGGQYYNFWTDASHPRGVWRRTTPEEYQKPNPRWEVVLDLDALARSEKESWVWGGAGFLPRSYDRCLISLSRGGADASVVREFDLKAKAFVKDGFVLPEAKSTVAWRDRDSVFVATDFGPGSLTKSQYPRLVKEWKRGTPLSEARLVYEGKPDDLTVVAGRDHTKGFERDIVIRQMTMYTQEVFLRQDGKLVKIATPDDAQTGAHGDRLFIELQSPWKVGETTYPTGALLATSLSAFLKGERRFDVLFTPAPRKSLAGLTVTKNYLILNELDNVHNRLYVLERKKGAWQRTPLPGVPAFSTVAVAAVDAEGSDEYVLTVTDFLTPATRYLGAVGKGPAKKVKASPSFFDAKGLVVTQHEATSKDGTRVPYFQVSRKDLGADGKNPTLLYGYGGFGIPLVPGYDPLTGAAWLEKGGVYVVANVRGGGEFGPQWHQAAIKGKRQRGYEDFIAVAEDLIRRKVTAPKHLGILGGSNGGLLVGNMLVQRPDLFGAVVCQSPLLDMERYTKLLAGPSWIAEYGDPDNPKERPSLRAISPYHNVKRGVRYPRTLFTTSTRDDRVHPGHARKMAARMKALGHDVLFYENVEGGHAGAADDRQAAFLTALAFQFLWQELK
jgi:prolyl oligopeptidase